MQSTRREIVLSIAGFDPSAGAGVLADIKTFEALKVYGLGISTATTFQTDKTFVDCTWENIETVKKQMHLLFARFAISTVKIGIVPNLDFLAEIVHEIKKLSPSCTIVWDPVYRSSTGYAFFEKITNENLFQQVLQKITLITPNQQEVLVFAQLQDAYSSAKKLNKHTSVLLKGGHSGGVTSNDNLLLLSGDEIVLKAERMEGVSKHGSGCVLSAAIAAHLAKGESIEQACVNAKKYITTYLKSNSELLGYHVA